MKNVIITILVVLVLGLGGYLVYDRVIAKDELVTENQEIKGEVNNQENKVEKEYTYEDLAGNYYFETDAKIDFMPGAMAVFWLNIDKEGTFAFKYTTGNAPYHLFGNYYIEKDKIIFNYNFQMAGDEALYYKVGTFALTIDNEANLISTLGNEVNSTSLERIKGTELVLKKDSSEKAYLKSFAQTFKYLAGDDGIINCTDDI